MNPKDYLLYVVLNDPGSRSDLTTYLRLQGFGVMMMATKAELLLRVKLLRPDLIVLDADLPSGDGLKACQALRAREVQVPIIFLGEGRELADRVLGLEMGADGFVGKPYALREIYARVRALLRRAVKRTDETLGDDEVVMVGQSAFSRSTRRIGISGQQVRLSSVDCLVLAELVSHPELVISRERLLASSRDEVGSLHPTAVGKTVVRLRRLIEVDTSAPRYIKNVRGRGYVYSPTGN